MITARMTHLSDEGYGTLTITNGSEEVDIEVPLHTAESIMAMELKEITHGTNDDTK